MKSRLVCRIFVFTVLALVLTAPAMAQDTTAQMAAPGIQIENTVVCQNVVDRAPVGVGDVFAKETEKVYCYCKVVGATQPTEITFNWYHQGSLQSTVKLPVRSASWRTWSYKSMSPDKTGEWMVEILTADGSPLESIIFFIQ